MAAAGAASFAADSAAAAVISVGLLASERPSSSSGGGGCCCGIGSALSFRGSSAAAFRETNKATYFLLTLSFSESSAGIVWSCARAASEPSCATLKKLRHRLRSALGALDRVVRWGLRRSGLGFGTHAEASSTDIYTLFPAALASVQFGFVLVLVRDLLTGVPCKSRTKLNKFSQWVIQKMIKQEYDSP